MLKRLLIVMTLMLFTWQGAAYAQVEAKYLVPVTVRTSGTLIAFTIEISLTLDGVRIRTASPTPNMDVSFGRVQVVAVDDADTTLTVAALPTPTRTPLPTVTPTPEVPKGPTANRSANIRSGPSTSYDIVNAATEGQSLNITGQNADGNWYQIDDSVWIAAFLVNNPPASTPIVAVPPTSPTQQKNITFQTPVESVDTNYMNNSMAANAIVIRDTYIHECFGTGDSELREAKANTPIQVVGNGPFVPPPSQQEQLTGAEFLKIRIWDGQVAWMSVADANVDASQFPSVSGICEEHDRIDWQKVVRPTPTPIPVIRNFPPETQQSCCKICTTGKACGDSCISRNKTCRKGSGCACNG